MTLVDGRVWNESQFRSLAATHDRAANVHDLAAVVHDRATRMAEFRGDEESAQRFRATAEAERQRAARERQHAESLRLLRLLVGA